jgi:hypothetical protein
MGFLLESNVLMTLFSIREEGEDDQRKGDAGRELERVLSGANEAPIRSTTEKQGVPSALSCYSRLAHA